MFDDPSPGRGLRASERSRMLVATEDGVFLWSGTALVYRQGNGFFAAEPRALNSAIGTLFGPAALDLPLQPILERARDDLRRGRVVIVQQMLDRLRLPPISRNGQQLMRAISARQDIVLPDWALATIRDAAIWNERDISLFARLYDSVVDTARRLEKVFNPGALNPRSPWDSDKHPRHPAGEPDGGEFAPSRDGDGSPIIPVAGPQTPWSRKPKKPLGPPPNVPKKDPIASAARYLAIRTVAYWLIRAGAAGSEVVAPEIVGPVMAAVEAVTWLAPYIKRYFDPAKTLEELQAAVDDPQPGTNTHHIVEQKSARDAGFPQSKIDDPTNLVQIPELKHWELNHWYSQPNKGYGGQTPRQYVQGKDWDTRRKVGLDGLRAVGVLK